MPINVVIHTSHCPRCDRGFDGTTEQKAFEAVVKHVVNQHPDHDPEWYKD